MVLEYFMRSNYLKNKPKFSSGKKLIHMPTSTKNDLRIFTITRIGYSVMRDCYYYEGIVRDKTLNNLAQYDCKEVDKLLLFRELTKTEKVLYG